MTVTELYSNIIINSVLEENNKIMLKNLFS